MDEMTRAYLECALWASIDNDGNPLDDGGRGIDAFAPAAIEKAAEDCAAFCQTAAQWVRQLPQGVSLSQMGHDFWLTRNRHGAGFWDRGYPKAPADELTRMSHAFGEVSAVLGNDGRVYLE